MGSTRTRGEHKCAEGTHLCDLMSVKESASILAHLLRIGGTCARQAEPNEA